MKKKTDFKAVVNSMELFPLSDPKHQRKSSRSLLQSISVNGPLRSRPGGYILQIGSKTRFYFTFHLYLYFQTYFEDNPRDLQLLRHDKALHTVKVQSHLRNVPDYLGSYSS